MDTTTRNRQHDSRLSALLDNEITEPGKSDMERLLAADPQVKSRQECLQRGNEYGIRGFDAILKEPVPLDLVRAIRTARQPRRAIKVKPSPRAVIRLRPSIGTIAALSLVMFVLGGGAGYMLASRPHIKTFAEISGETTNAWLDDVASHYRLFYRQPRHLVEVPASESAHIVEWLMSTTGVSFRIPDLTAEGLQFVGARLFAAAGRPVGQLIYHNADGEIISIAFTKTLLPQQTEMSETIRDDIGLVVWQGQQASYVLTGPSSEAALESLATKAAGIL